MDVVSFSVANKYQCDGGKDVTLGEGSYGKVYLGYDIITKKRVRTRKFEEN